MTINDFPTLSILTYIKPTVSPAGVSDLVADTKATITGWYDLNGRRLSSPPHSPGIYITVYSDGTKKKCFWHF